MVLANLNQAICVINRTKSIITYFNTTFSKITGDGNILGRSFVDNYIPCSQDKDTINLMLSRLVIDQVAEFIEVFTISNEKGLINK
jgi:hypothetical protein